MRETCDVCARTLERGGYILTHYSRHDDVEALIVTTCGSKCTHRAVARTGPLARRLIAKFNQKWGWLEGLERAAAQRR